MASPRIEYAVLPAGDGPGQDRCFTADGLVVVLDGASTIDPGANPDATTYVDTLGPLLVEQLTATPGVDLRRALAEAIRAAMKKLSLVPGTGPSATVSVVRWGHETVDVLVLGDSPVVVGHIGGSQETIVQHPQKHIAVGLRNLYRDRLAAGHGYDDEHRAILSRIQRHEARQRNRQGGYWIAEACPRAARYSNVASIPESDVLFVVLLTDGASVPLSGGAEEAVPTSQIIEAADLGLHDLLLSLRELEERDPDGRDLPRSKRHDDKTVAIMMRGEEKDGRGGGR